MKKFLFLPGGLMIVAAVLWAGFQVRWDTTALVLAGGGGCALLIAMAANWQGIRDWFRDPRGIFVLNSVMTTLLLIAVLGLVNAMATFGSAQVDLTATGRNTLTAETREGLRRVSRDVLLKQYGRVRDTTVDQILANFAAESRRLQTAYIDPETAPQEARTYGVLRDGTVVVSSGTRWRKVEKVTEPALYQAVSQVSAEREPLVCVATGDGEHGLDDQGARGVSHLAAALTAASYRLERVALQAGPIPTRCEVLFVAGPSAGLPTESLGRIHEYLGSGGRVALLVDPPVPADLRSWLAERGIVPGDGMIIETNPAGRQVGAGPESPLALKYFGHSITTGFEVATIYDRAVPLNVLKDVPIGLPEPLAGTGDRAFERLDFTTAGTEFREGRDRPGPFLLAVATRFPRGLKQDQRVQEGRMVVFGDSDFVSNAYLGRQGNRDLVLRVIAWLAGEKESRVVSVSDRQNRRTSLTEQMKTVMYSVNLGVIPLLPLLGGLIQLFRSRR